MLALVRYAFNANDFRRAAFAVASAGALLALALWPSTAVAAGHHYELIETVPDQWPDPTWTITPGHITLTATAGNYKSEYQWSAPPASFGEDGFDISLSITAISVNANNYSGTGLSGKGFKFDKDPAGIDAYSEGKGTQTKSNSGSIHVTPDTSYGDGETLELHPGAYYGPGVVYRYKVVGGDYSSSEEQASSSEEDSSSSDGASNLHADIDCPPDITIGAPPLNCHLIIGGFRHNTADAISVYLPDEADAFGNHENGIQVFSTEGEQDVYNMDDPYSWGFFVIACPTDSHVGGNCYDFKATPGTTASVTFEVCQADDCVSPVLAFNVLGKGAPPPNTATGPVYYIGSRQFPGSFINVEHGSPQVTPIVLDWLSARWEFVPVEGTGDILIRSTWHDDQYLIVDSNVLAIGPADTSSAAAMWTLVPADAGFTYIVNAENPDLYLNVQHGRLAATPVQPDWRGAQWWLLH